MLGDIDIDRMIGCEKIIVEPPRKEMKVEKVHKRNGMKLQSADKHHEFEVFMRQSLKFIEDFSIGLVYLDQSGRRITLIRFNGQHHQSNDPLNAHPHFMYHIHKATSDNIKFGKLEKHPASSTDLYASFQDAIHEFGRVVNIRGYDQHFPRNNVVDLFSWAGAKDGLY